MSLHIRLTPEAQAILKKNKRNSTISSIIIAIVICAMLGTLLEVIVIKGLFKNNQETIARTASSQQGEEQITEPEFTNQVEQKPSAPSSNIAKALAANTASPIAVPVPEIEVSDSAIDFGDADDFGAGWGSDSDSGFSSGSGGETDFTIASTLSKRCSTEDRQDRIRKEGGRKSFDTQVINALKYLQKTQSSNGSWTAQNKPVGMTGLALLAYLGHCETPQSAEFGETVNNAIIYLVNIANKNQGKLASNYREKTWPYEHSIATYALAESYTLCREFGITIPHLDQAVQDAAAHIIKHQNATGGWDYSYGTGGKRGGDTSIVCWHLQALKACKLTELVPSDLRIQDIDKSAAKALKYLENSKGEIRGTVGYHTNGGYGRGGPSMTPGAALCLQQWNKGNTSFCRSLIKWQSANNNFNYKSTVSHGANLYQHYYASQAMINSGGREWRGYNTKTIYHIAENQNKDGSWTKPSGGSSGMLSDHYATCLATLILEVYYRFIPTQ